MKISVILLSLAASLPALAGTRGGGSGAGAVLIPADSIHSGGGTGTGGSGSAAVVNLSSFGGIAGTVTAVTPATANRQGWIPQILPPPLTGYDLWASQNIPAGRPAGFDADADGDGMSNGLEYAFGSTVLDFDSTLQRFRIEYPATVPSDVDLYLERSLTLAPGSWLVIVSWLNGAAPVAAAGIELQARVRDPIRITEPRAYYRYRAVKR